MRESNFDYWSYRIHSQRIHLSVKLITLRPEQIHIHADRRLAFQVLTAFGASGEEKGKPSSEVIEDGGDTKLVRFTSNVSLLGKQMTYTSLENVRLVQPERIEFSLVPGKGIITGGLKELEDKFTLTDNSGCTVLKYESAFGIRWSWSGWLVGKLIIAQIIKSHMRSHLKEVKETIEARARRSRVFPQVTVCPEIDQ